MSSKYGFSVYFSGPISIEISCKADIAALMVRASTQKPETSFETYLGMPGSYGVHIKEAPDIKGGGFSLNYMLPCANFWSDVHIYYLDLLAAQWPALSLRVYGDSYEDGVGSRSLYIGGQLLVRDDFELDQHDQPQIQARTWGVRPERESEPVIPPEFAGYFALGSCVDIGQSWEQVREEVVRSSATGLPIRDQRSELQLKIEQSELIARKKRLELIAERIIELEVRGELRSTAETDELAQLRTRHAALDRVVAQGGALIEQSGGA